RATRTRFRMGRFSLRIPVLVGRAPWPAADPLVGLLRSPLWFPNPFHHETPFVALALRLSLRLCASALKRRSRGWKSSGGLEDETEAAADAAGVFYQEQLFA